MSDSLPPPPPSFNEPPGYPVGGPGGSPRPAGNNGKATLALVCGLVGLIIPLVGIVGIVLGVIARGEIKRTGQAGDGMAIAGIVCGILGLIGGVAFFAATQ